MQVQLKPWGNSQGIRLSKDILRAAGISENEYLEVEAREGVITLKRGFRHRSLKERAAAFGGKLNLSEELAEVPPEGSEVW